MFPLAGRVRKIKQLHDFYLILNSVSNYSMNSPTYYGSLF